MPFSRQPLSVSILSLLLASPLAAQTAPSTPVDSTTRLDEVVVTASPLGRSAFDSAQPVSTLSGTPLKLKLGPTLGETLNGQPGVSASAYTPGASRPIIRGLSDNRVLVLQNGTDVFDVSNLSPDHGPSVQPLNAQSIEVVRGPATILYGSSAIGGVVNVLDRRIPTVVPTGPVSGEINGRFSSGTLERSSSANFDIRATDHLVFHLDGTILRTDNLRVPGYAFSERKRREIGEVRRERGSQYGGDPEHLVPNTSVKSQDYGIGVSYVGERGYLGFAFSQFINEYGIPDGGDFIDDPTEFPGRVKLDINKRRYELRGSLQDPLPWFTGANFKAAYTEYKHHELDDNIVASTFRTRGLDSRLELVHQPVGKWEGSLGFQGTYRTLGVYGSEAFLRPNQTAQGAAFVFEELNLSPVRFQFGARVEYQRTHIGSDDPEFTSLQRGDKREQDFVPISGAAGLIYDLNQETNIAFTTRYSERAPSPEELFARGPHEATFQYLVGNPDIGKERVLGLDLSLRKRSGFITGSLSAFYNHFFDYIDFQDTGVLFEDDLPVFNYANKRASFFGGEAQVAFHLLPQTVSAPVQRGDGKSVKELVSKEVANSEMPNPHDLYVEFSGDYVQAEDETEDRSLGRITPLRYGGALGYQSPKVGARVEVLRVNRQDRTAEFESETEGYTFLNVSLSYNFQTGPLNCDLYVKGTNLTDEEGRDHTSFLKDVLPLQGRSVTVGVRTTF